MSNVVISLKIPENKIEEFRVHFLLAEPKEDFEGTDLEWITYLLKNYCRVLYRKGKQIAASTVIEYEDIIEEDN